MGTLQAVWIQGRQARPGKPVLSSMNAMAVLNCWCMCWCRVQVCCSWLQIPSAVS